MHQEGLGGGVEFEGGGEGHVEFGVEQGLGLGVGEGGPVGEPAGEVLGGGGRATGFRQLADETDAFGLGGVDGSPSISSRVAWPRPTTRGRR